MSAEARPPAARPAGAAMSRTYHWPTDEGWLMVIMFVVLATVAGGWRGALLMVAFGVVVSVLGNLLLP